MNSTRIFRTCMIATLPFIMGVSLTYLVLSQFSGNSMGAQQSEQDDSNKVLYWVAPMDDNYRRDEPGKSPMGMDLVPVYADSQRGRTDTVYIAPNVINNLGVRTQSVEFKALQQDIVTLGYVQYDQDQMLHVHTRVDGWIEQLFIKAAGEPVQQGQPLYALYSPQLVNAQEEYVLALERQNRTLIKAAKQRLEALHLSESFIKNLTRTKQVQQTVTFYSPKSGVIDGLKVREGFFVKPTNTLLSIAQIDQVWVEVDVFERDAGKITPGLAVKMQLDAFAGDVWHGVVDYIYPALSEKTRTLKARLKFANPEHKLKPNMFAQVTIFTKATAPSMVVPQQAVIRTGVQDKVVVALGKGEFKSVAVKLGITAQQQVQILSGLLAQDQVVTSAQFLIDSESSKNSDLLRLESQSDYQSARVDGVINRLDKQNRLANISRGAIAKWGREPSTMDFLLAPRLDISQLNEGDNISFLFEVRDELTITELTVKPTQFEPTTVEQTP